MLCERQEKEIKDSGNEYHSDGCPRCWFAADNIPESTDIAYIYEKKGEFWIEIQHEYNIRVNYCPTCGLKAPKQFNPDE